MTSERSIATPELWRRTHVHVPLTIRIGALRAAGAEFLIGEDHIAVHDPVRGIDWIHAVPDDGVSIGALCARPTARVDSGASPDGDRVVCFYDPDDGNLGYALNLDAPQRSGWGYASL